MGFSSSMIGIPTYVWVYLKGHCSSSWISMESGVVSTSKYLFSDLNGGFLTWRLPLNHHPFSDGIFHYKPNILGIPHGHGNTLKWILKIQKFSKVDLSMRVNATCDEFPPELNAPSVGIYSIYGAIVPRGRSSGFHGISLKSIYGATGSNRNESSSVQCDFSSMICPCTHDISMIYHGISMVYPWYIHDDISMRYPIHGVLCGWCGGREYLALSDSGDSPCPWNGDYWGNEVSQKN